MPAHCAPARTRPSGLTLAARFCDTEFYLIKLSGSNMVNISQITWSEHMAIGTWSQITGARGSGCAACWLLRGAHPVAVLAFNRPFEVAGCGVRGAEVSTLSYFALPYGSHWLSLTAWLLALHVVSFRFRIALAFSAISHYRRFLHECGAACLRLRRGRPQHLIIRMLTVEFHPGLHGSAQIHHRDDAENSRDVA